MRTSPRRQGCARLVQSLFVECSAQRADASVHHVGRRHHIDAGLRMAYRLTYKSGNRDVVGNVTSCVEQTVLAMAGVRIERDVGYHA